MSIFLLERQIKIHEMRIVSQNAPKCVWRPRSARNAGKLQRSAPSGTIIGSRRKTETGEGKDICTFRAGRKRAGKKRQEKRRGKDDSIAKFSVQTLCIIGVLWSTEILRNTHAYGRWLTIKMRLNKRLRSVASHAMKSNRTVRRRAVRIRRRVTCRRITNSKPLCQTCNFDGTWMTVVHAYIMHGLQRFLAEKNRYGQRLSRILVWKRTNERLACLTTLHRINEYETLQLFIFLAEVVTFNI